MQKSRDASFDFIKGILAFLVVWGHVIQYLQGSYQFNPIYIWIYSFHMPLFIFISGYFALETVNNSFNVCLKSRIKRLLIPALLWTVLIFLIIDLHGVTSVRGGYRHYMAVSDMYGSFTACLFFIW